jgi:hypothetical protein
LACKSILKYIKTSNIWESKSYYDLQSLNILFREQFIFMKLESLNSLKSLKTASEIQGQNSWWQMQRCQVRFLVLPDFLSSSGCGTGCIQPHENNWRATYVKSSGCGVGKPRLTAMGIRCAGHNDTPLPTKVGTYFTNQQPSVGIVCLRTKSHSFFYQLDVCVWFEAEW